MVHTNHDSATRSVGAAAIIEGKTGEDIFLRRGLHHSMDPSRGAVREVRGSETHPTTYPAALFLDVTGSMVSTSNHIVREGLSNIMDSIIQAGVPDIALLLGGIGDHVSDQAPLQLGQFESGDVELDTWLTRTWMESGGGGTGEESYLLAWVAATLFQTDSVGPRDRKGVLITVGDEWCHQELSASHIGEVFGPDADRIFGAFGMSGPGSISMEEALERVRHDWSVYHLAMVGHDHDHNHRSVAAAARWEILLGPGCVRWFTTPQEVPGLVRDIVVQNAPLSKEAIETRNAQSLVLHRDAQ